MSFRSWARNQLIRIIGRFRQPTERTERPLYRILSYHRLPADQQVAFKHQLDRLQKHYNIVTPDQFRANAGAPDKLNILLTFDDGYLDWESRVLRELSRRDLKGVFFVCPDFVGLNKNHAATYCHEHLKLEPSLPLTDDGAFRILENGHTLGNHLVQHSDLRDITDPDTIRDVFQESQGLFEERFDYQPDWVAYPFGDYFESPETLASVAREFFDVGVTLKPGFNRPETNSFLLHRDGFSPDLSPAVENAWLRGGYDPLFAITHLGYR